MGFTDLWNSILPNKGVKGRMSSKKSVILRSLVSILWICWCGGERVSALQYSSRIVSNLLLYSSWIFCNLLSHCYVPLDWLNFFIFIFLRICKIRSAKYLSNWEHILNFLCACVWQFTMLSNRISIYHTLWKKYSFMGTVDFFTLF
jgi:hypothetical protein